ncbi:hypothetical protein Sste5344_002116 [Sporothrix stenoceras]
MDAGSNSNCDGTIDDDTRSRFVIVHPDVHLGNILVDDGFHITGILNWSATSTGPLDGLLVSPMSFDMLEEQPSLMVAYRDEFRKGHIEHDGIDGGRITYSCGYEFSPAQWNKAEMLNHFRWLVAMGTRNVQGYPDFQQLYKLVYADGVDDEIEDDTFNETGTDIADKTGILIAVADGCRAEDTKSHKSPAGDVRDNSIASDSSTTGDCNTADDTNTPDSSVDSRNNTGCTNSKETKDTKELIDKATDCNDHVDKDYDYDVKMLDVFRKHHALPYARAELARLDKEKDEEASSVGREAKEKHRGLCRTVAYKLVVLQSMNTNLVPDTRLWKWIADALAEQTKGIRDKHWAESKKKVEAYRKAHDEGKMKEEEKEEEEGPTMATKSSR